VPAHLEGRRGGGRERGGGGKVRKRMVELRGRGGSEGILQARAASCGFFFRVKEPRERSK
jgi:hypothetical protein